MLNDDVVAELDRWLDNFGHYGYVVMDIERDKVQRARNEIVALREQLSLMRFDHPSDIRAEALEEAARRCEEMSSDDPSMEHMRHACATAIRSLKEGRHE